MSKKGYPRCVSRSQVKPSNSKGTCQVTGCTAPATWEVELQFTWFRSDDSTVKCCNEHCTIKSVSEPKEVRAFCEQFPREVFI